MSLFSNTHCFFCYKITPSDNIKEEAFDYDQVGLFDCRNYYKDRLKFKREAIKQNILQISHYLQVPRNILQEEIDKFSDHPLQNLTICQECEDISDKLGNLCDILEVTQLKVNYYLKLLSQKLVQNDDQAYSSKFQESIHKNCALKLLTIDTNPVVQLTKCLKVPRQSDEQLFTEEPLSEDPLASEDDNEVKLPIILQDELTENNLNDPGSLPAELQLTGNTDNYEEQPNFEESLLSQPIVTPGDPIIVPDANLGTNISCEYCPMTFGNRANQKRHILAVHMKKSPGTKPKSRPRLIKPCEYCGAMISSGNLWRHKILYHGGSGTSKVLKFEPCKTCGKLFETGWRMKRHLKETIFCGEGSLKFKCRWDGCGRVFSKKCNLDRHMDQTCELRKDLNPTKI